MAVFMEPSYNVKVCLTLASFVVLMSLFVLDHSDASDPLRRCTNSASGNEVKVCISPRNATLERLGSVSFTCHVYSMNEAKDERKLPSIVWAAWVARGTLLPLSNDLPGVSMYSMEVEPSEVEPSEVVNSDKLNACAEKLVLRPAMYPLLKYGPNVFECQGRNFRGDHNLRTFRVYKLREHETLSDVDADEKD